MSNIVDNKKIAKNTLALYFRQIMMMIVSLFTSRIVLQTLGVTDYGINNVVGGVVLMFDFMRSTLTGITQRFISIELGKGGDFNILRRIFSTSMLLHIAAALAVLILAQTVGLWFLNTQLVIPEERMVAANWVYQFAVFGFVMSLLNAPLIALVISHEDMHIFGHMGVFDVVVRLITVYLLLIVNTDKLLFFALFGFIVTLIVWVFYWFYCRWKYKYARFQWDWDKKLMRELCGFGGYTFFTNIFLILLVKGTDIILNIFHGPAVNAAKGLANSVDAAISTFGNNFRVAFIPQLTKSYASGDTNTTWTLVERGTRITYFLFFIFFVPILLKTDFILRLWLGNVPEYTVIFVKFIIIYSIITALFSFLGSIAIASGKLKAWSYFKYVMSALTLALIFLVSKLGYPPYYVFIVMLSVNSFFSYFGQLIIARKMFGFPIKFFTKKALVPVLLVSIISLIPFYVVDKLLHESFFYNSIIVITSMMWTGIVTMIVGLKKQEQINLVEFVKRKIGLTN